MDFTLLKKKIPCVVVSVCDSEWLTPTMVKQSRTHRGDSDGDLCYGGYDIVNLPVVCDLAIPGGPPIAEDHWILKSGRKQLTLSAEIACIPDKQKPSIIFFGPTTDPGTVERLMPLMTKYYTVDHFEDVAEAIEEVKKRDVPYTVCISKLGTKKNLGLYLMEAIKEKVGKETYIILHSATAMNNPETVEYFKSKGVSLFVDHDREGNIGPVINDLANKYAEKFRK